MYRLDSIRTLGASGSPLPEAGHQWVHENFGSDVVFNLGSGGTDVCTAFVQSGPWQRDWAGEMSGKCLGVNVVALDDGGHPVEDEFGELVVLDPMPSMPWASGATTAISATGRATSKDTHQLGGTATGSASAPTPEVAGSAGVAMRR